MKRFSKREAISFGWNTLKANWLFFIGLYIIYVVIFSLPSFIGETLFPDQNLILIPIYLITWITQTIFSIGLVKVYLRFVDGEQKNIADLYSYWKLFFYYLIASIVQGILILLGFILLIIPGIILAIKFQFWSYFLVDRGVGPIDALKKSWTVTSGSTVNLLLFGILLFLINLVGFLLIGVGLLVTVPLTTLASAYVYRKLEASKPAVL